MARCKAPVENHIESYRRSVKIRLIVHAIVLLNTFNARTDEEDVDALGCFSET